MAESNTISIVAIYIAGLSFVASVISCIIAGVQTSRAKEANRIAREANEKAEKANWIAERQFVYVVS